MKILVCGGAGFIGSTFIRNYLKNHPKDEIINLDSLTIGSNLNNLKDVEENRNYEFFHNNILNKNIVDSLVKRVDTVVNFAAESHVDRSISNPEKFIETNILGIHTLLEFVKKYDKLIIQVSTDEVYGDAKNSESFTEKSMLNPSNPYSATKASGDHLVSAYERTYKIKSIITRSVNNFGPFQYPEKLIPKTIIRARKKLKIPLYGDGQQIRSWIYVTDHVQAIDDLIFKGKIGETYNIQASNEISNIYIVKKILSFLNLDESLIEFVDERPGHDLRYSIDSSKIQSELDWTPKFEFEDALRSTVEWYKNNEKWWGPLIDKKLLDPTPWNLDWK